MSRTPRTVPQPDEQRPTATCETCGIAIGTQQTYSEVRLSSRQTIDYCEACWDVGAPHRQAITLAAKRAQRVFDQQTERWHVAARLAAMQRANAEDPKETDNGT